MHQGGARRTDLAYTFTGEHRGDDGPLQSRPIPRNTAKISDVAIEEAQTGECTVNAYRKMSGVSIVSMGLRSWIVRQTAWRDEKCGATMMQLRKPEMICREELLLYPPRTCRHGL